VVVIAGLVPAMTFRGTLHGHMNQDARPSPAEG